MGDSQEMQDGRVKLLLDGRAAPQIVTTALFCVRVVEKTGVHNVLTTRKLIVWGGGLV